MARVLTLSPLQTALDVHRDDLQAMERHVTLLARQADLATQTYDRHDRYTWCGYAVIFLVIPFVVLLFRLRMETWHYYVAGALTLVCAIAVAVLDLAAIAKRDEAIQAFERARAAYESSRAQ